MAELINLRQFKKLKKRQEKSSNADQNRALFGRTKVQKNFELREKQKDESFLDNNKLERNALSLSSPKITFIHNNESDQQND